MLTTGDPVHIILLIADHQMREFLHQFLASHNFTPQIVGHPGELLQALKGKEAVTIFVDCQTVSSYGPGLYARIKVAHPASRVVFLCDKAHGEHRDLVKEAMELGAYACLLAPLAEWEILALVRRGQAPKPTGRRQPRGREKP